MPANTEHNVDFNGTIRYQNLSGGFYGIVSGEGAKFDPIDLPGDFRVDGLEVQVSGTLRTDLDSYRMWGTLLELKSIEKR